jgi:hypothetical protein
MKHRVAFMRFTEKRIRKENANELDWLASLEAALDDLSKKGWRAKGLTSTTLGNEVVVTVLLDMPDETGKK